MAAFTHEDVFGNRLDWKILRDGGIALYERREFLDEDLNWFREQNYQVFSFDCGFWTSSEEMHADFEQTLALPAFYGKNLDALSDCLGDLPVPDASGTAFVLTHFDTYAKSAGARRVASGRPEADIVLDVLASTSRYFLHTARRFLTLVQTSDMRTQFENLGCVSAQWNWREWLNEDRGM